MDADSDSSESVVIIGPVPECAGVRRRRTRSTPSKRGRRIKKEEIMDVSEDDKKDKIHELEVLVKTSATVFRNGDNKDEDGDAWSGSDNKSLKGIGKRDPAMKYLKKIKTLQQNKRRQETRISRLTKEVKSLRDKVSVQAAYIDVLCGMLGDDMKEKFQDRQGMGILGNTKIEDSLGGIDALENGEWFPDDEAKGLGETGHATKKENEYYCIEDLERNDLSRAGSSEDLKEATEIKDTSESNHLERITKQKHDKDEAKQRSRRDIKGCPPDGKQIGLDGQTEIHHGVHGGGYRHIRTFEGQFGESVFAPGISKVVNPFGDMRTFACKDPMPQIISYGVVGNHGLSLLPAVHPTTDDPLNIGEDASFGPLIISTGLDPLNVTRDSNRTRFRQQRPSLDPLNIEADNSLIDDPRNLPHEIDPIGSNESSALLISVPSSAKQKSHQPIVTALSTHFVDEMSNPSSLVPNQIGTSINHRYPTDDLPMILPDSREVRPGLSMPDISDALDHCPVKHESGNISQPQAIVDHLVNNIPCDIPVLRLE